MRFPQGKAEVVSVLSDVVRKFTPIPWGHEPPEAQILGTVSRVPHVPRGFQELRMKFYTDVLVRKDKAACFFSSTFDCCQRFLAVLG